MQGGRPKGSVSKATLERMEVEKAIKQRIFAHADELLNAQLSLAKGITHVFRIDEEEVNGKKVRKHVLVTDPEEIIDLLDAHEGGDGVVGESYYYISTKDPNSIAIDSLFNRGIGKPTDTLDITSKGEQIAPSDSGKFKEIAGKFEEEVKKNVKHSTP